MIRFENNPIIHLRRPAIVRAVAEALGVKPFELLGELIAMQIFVAPHQDLSDENVHALGRRIGVDFRIDEDGGSSTVPTRPTNPVPPAHPTEAEPPAAPFGGRPLP